MNTVPDATYPALIKRDKAAARGLVRYFSGEPCSRGHIAERRVVGNRCVECHRLAARANRAAGSGVRDTAGKAVRRIAPHVEGWPSLNDLKELFTVESLQAAMAAGHKRYFTGTPCSAGHIDQRSTANQKCIACDRYKSSSSNRSRVLELWNMIRALRPLQASLPEWPRITQAEAAKKGLKRFYEGTMCAIGHVGLRYTGNGECVTCSRTRNRDRYANDPQFRQRRIEDEVARNRSEKVRAVRLVKAKEYNARPSVRSRLLQRLKTDAPFRVRWNISSLLRMTLKKHGHKKRSGLQDILGCSIEDFRTHITKQFLEGMTWSNYGEWEFDHIVPLSSAKTSEDVVALFHHTNIRPLYRGANRSKRDKRIYLI
ncbi:hypothetical protein [Massilia sp. Leaf139]|uniref:hypothetical protein n=1 Tax=Massilia sp. Leaf139 TaxID=1736272 RepID=UPI000A953FFE|nr:hypothetical protein [Massilia sp. Leaf139]